eukprot:6179620-Pleurochrysis_carterae.AAC.3
MSKTKHAQGQYRSCVDERGRVLKSSARRSVLVRVLVCSCVCLCVRAHARACARARVRACVLRARERKQLALWCQKKSALTRSSFSAAAEASILTRLLTNFDCDEISVKRAARHSMAEFCTKKQRMCARRPR